MSSFYDELDIQEATVREAVTRLGLDKERGVFFLKVTYEDEPRAGDPPPRLAARLADLPFIRPGSRGQKVRPLPPPGRPLLTDKVTGESGWAMAAGTTAAPRSPRGYTSAP